MEQITQRQWVERRAYPGDLVEQFRSRFDLLLPAAQVLASRGFVHPDDVSAFLHARLGSLPDPFLMRGMEGAAIRIADAVERREKILVHGDYDVDGITGTTLLVETLSRFGAEVDFFIPLRLVDGYGLSASALEEAATDGAKVVLSVDCGITAIKEAALAGDLGLDLVITDHHLPGDSLPQACALVDPHLPDCPFPDKNLSGVGVAFFLMVAVRKILRDRGVFVDGAEPDLRYALDLVALGTIADVVPLIGVNRLLVRSGLELMQRGGRPGIDALREVAGVDEVNSGAVGFRLAPRLNAAGRLEDAGIGVSLLLESDRGAATKMAQQLDEANRRRQQIEDDTLCQALEKLSEFRHGHARSIVLADERWHPGVIGIVASRLVERYHRPVVLVALDGEQGKGSARSIPGFHLYDNLKACSDHLQGFGGHEAAAGLSVDRDHFDDFARAFEEQAGQVLDEDHLTPNLYHDGELDLEELGLAEVEQLRCLAPYGMGNPEPVFLARNLSLRQVQVVGKGHLRFTACQGGYSFGGIGFSMASRKESFQGPVDLLFSPGINQWRGRTSVQLKLKDFRPASG